MPAKTLKTSTWRSRGRRRDQRVQVNLRVPAAVVRALGLDKKNRTFAWYYGDDNGDGRIKVFLEEVK